MKKMKKLYTALAAMTFLFAVAFPSWASATEIKKINLTLSAEIYAEEENYYAEADVSTTGCYVDDEVSFTNEPSEGYWDEGDTPKVRIIVRAEDDYQFVSGLGKDDITYSGPGKVTDVSRSKTKLTIKVTLPEVEYSDDYYDDVDSTLSVTGVKWDKDDGEGYWSRNSYADAYEVKLYRDDNVIMKAKETTSRRYDFSSHFTKKGTYMFKVRAMDDDGNYGAWKSSAEWSVSTTTANKLSGNTSSSTNNSNTSGPGYNDSSSGNAGPGTTTNTSNGQWLQNSVGWWWCNSDRSYPISSWKQINNKWYYFNSAGYCVQSDWVKTNNKWYYCDTNGDMAVSCWKQIKGLWYYLNASGECVQNAWVLSNGKYYYCGPDGDMWTNRRTPDGYWVNADGVWVK